MITWRARIAVAILLCLMMTDKITAQISLPPPTLFIIGSESADLLTTVNALRFPGAYETSPFGGGLPRMIATKAVTTGVLLWSVHILRVHGHPRIAAIVGYGMSAEFSFVAIHNWRLVH